MKDLIIKNTGNSRWMKSSIPKNTTHQELVDLLNEGVFPFDLNGLNPEGIEQMGTAMSKATLLQDETADKVWFGGDAPTDPVVDRALQKIASNLREAETYKIGEDWSVVTSTLPSSGDDYATAYGNGRYIAILRDSNICYYSDDGENWQETTMPANTQWHSATYGDGKFVAVSGYLWNYNIAAYSEDGITWDSATLPTSMAWKRVMYANGVFIAVGELTDHTVTTNMAYSTDGINWTRGTMPTSALWQNVAFGNGKFVAIGYSKNYSWLYTAYSTDGQRWTAGSTLSGESDMRASAIAYGSNVFVILLGYEKIAYYSEDGENWVSSTYPGSGHQYSVVYGKDRFIGVGGSVIYSFDGIAWEISSVSLRSDTIIYNNDEDTFFIAPWESENTATLLTITDITQTDVVNKYGFAYALKLLEVSMPTAARIVTFDLSTIDLTAYRFVYLDFFGTTNATGTSVTRAVTRLSDENGAAGTDKVLLITVGQHYDSACSYGYFYGPSGVCPVQHFHMTLNTGSHKYGASCMTMEGYQYGGHLTFGYVYGLGWDQVKQVTLTLDGSVEFSQLKLIVTGVKG